MKQSDWMKGLLYAELKTRNMETSGEDKFTIVKTLSSILLQESYEYLCSEEWCLGVTDYLRHYKDKS